MNNVICLCDGNLMAHKALHTLQRLTLEDGTPTGVIFGFLKQLITINEKFTPDNIIVVWDGGSQRRKKISADYKANRKPPHPEEGFHQQILVLTQILHDLGIDQVLVPGEEADDIIGCICNDKKDDKIIIITNDHDMQQLIRDNVYMYANNKMITRQVIKEMYGVEPEQLVEIFALQGDVTDNIKGVAGIGKKTASKLIQKYQSVEKILTGEVVDDIKKAQVVKDHADEARLARQLVEINTNIPYTIEKGQVDLEVVRSLFIDYFKFNSFIEQWESVVRLTKRSS